MESRSLISLKLRLFGGVEVGILDCSKSKMDYRGWLCDEGGGWIWWIGCWIELLKTEWRTWVSMGFGRDVLIWGDED